MAQAKVGRAKLQEAYSLAARFITGKDWQAIFNHIRVSIRGNKVFLCGVSGRTYIERTVDPLSTIILSEEGETDVMVPPDIFKKLVSSDPSPEITLTIDKGALIIEGQGKFKVLGHMDLEDYWDLSDLTPTVEVPWEGLRRSLERAQHFISPNSGNFQIQGARIRVTGGVMTVTSTDGIAVIQATVPCDSEEEFDAIITAEGIEALSTIDSKIVLILDSGNVRYVTGLIRGSVACLNGEFPNVSPLLDSIESAAVATVGVQDLLEATKRVQILGDGNTPIRYKCIDGQLELSTEKSGRGSGKIALECETIEGFEVLLNPQYIVNFLRHVLESRIKKVNFSLNKAVANGAMPITLSVDDDCLAFQYLATTQESKCI